MKKKLLLFVMLSITIRGIAQSMTVSGGTWTPTLASIAEAGNDYALSTIQSSTTQTNISVSMPEVFFGFFGNSYLVNVRRVDSGVNWDGVGLQIWSRRTGNGTGGGSSFFGTSSVTGGNITFQQITTSNSFFFEGVNFGTTPRSNIPIQYEIRGISVLVPVNNYATTIIYTLIDD